VESKWKNYHIITFQGSLSPKTLSLEEAMDLSRDRNELFIIIIYQNMIIVIVFISKIAYHRTKLLLALAIKVILGFGLHQESRP
jgi:hypothetical protein